MSGAIALKGTVVVSDPYQADQQTCDLRWQNNMKPPKGTRCISCRGEAQNYWLGSSLCDSCFCSAFEKAKTKQRGKLSTLLVGGAKIVWAGEGKIVSFFCSSQVDT